ncbi:MAG: hypothetical protein E6X92_08690, partial [Clostridiaceae bacterium]|nr:hypothetical protein [Clostridiaceae bacterium]
HGNTSSITAKLRLVSTQNLLANHSCSIMRYCLKLSSIFITPKRKTVQDLIFRPICGNIKVEKVNIFPSRQTVADFLLYRKCPIVVSQRTLR